MSLPLLMLVVNISSDSAVVNHKRVTDTTINASTRTILTIIMLIADLFSWCCYLLICEPPIVNTVLVISIVYDVLVCEISIDDNHYCPDELCLLSELNTN